MIEIKSNALDKIELYIDGKLIGVYSTYQKACLKASKYCKGQGL